MATNYGMNQLGIGVAAPREVNFIQEYQQREIERQQEEEANRSPFEIAAEQQAQAIAEARNKPWWQRVWENTLDNDPSTRRFDVRQPEWIPSSELVRAAEERGTIPPSLPMMEEPTMMAEPTQTGPTFSEMLAAQQFDGSPYDMAGDYLLERRQAQLEAVQNMYNQYAAEAAENAQRVADIYAGAESGIGETYGGAQELTESAYSSAQQQAADQLARLGIEEAAPAVVNPMALSQAEAMSNLVANQAAGTGAVQRFGATSGDFASQMAQVAQQQAVEQQDRFTSQLADQLFEIEMQRAQAQAAYNPYSRMMNELQARQAFENFYNPPADPAERELALELARQQVENQMQYDTNLSRNVQEFMSQGYEYDEALQMAANLLTYNPYMQ